MAKKSALGRQKAIQGWTFISPAIIIMTIFCFASVALAFYLSFCKVNYATGLTTAWVGLDNYRHIFEDPKVVIALKNTLKFVILTVPFQVVFALIIASILHSGVLKFNNVFRTAYFLPSLTSTAVLSMLFLFLFNVNGPVNDFLVNAGIVTEPVEFLTSEKYALPTVVVMNIWQSVPYFMMIYLAGMSDIPTSLYESATLDGCGRIKQWWYITLPQVRSITAFVFMMSMIWSFQLFDQVYIVSGGSGGPNYSTLSMVLLIYQNAFMNAGMMGYACALSMLFGLIIFVVTLITRKIQSSTEESLY